MSHSVSSPSLRLPKLRNKVIDLITQPIEIGDGCWIAACAFIGPGAEVPAGTMVKAGEVWKR